MKQEEIVMKAKSPVEKLITWAEALSRYMGVAMKNRGSEKLAEIAIDLQDQQTLNKIIKELYKLLEQQDGTDKERKGK